jgi:predicted PurR-regulated permease PerM
MPIRKPYQVQRITYIVILVLFSLVFISPFLIPILLAGSVSLALYPLQVRLEKKLKRPKWTAVLLTFSFTTIVSIPFIFFLIKGAQTFSGFMAQSSSTNRLSNHGLEYMLKTLRGDIYYKIQHFISNWPFASFFTEKRLDHYLEGVINLLLRFFQNFAADLPSVFIFFLVMVLSIYFFLVHGLGIRVFFQKLFGFDDHRMHKLVTIFISNARQIYFSNIVTGTIQSIIVATGIYFVVKVDWFVVFFITFVLSFVPVVGASPIAFLFTIFAFIQGNSLGAFILFGLGCFAGVIDNLLRPWLASFGESKISPVVALVFVLGGALLLGLPGLFIGLLVGAISFDSIPLFWEEVASERSVEKESINTSSLSQPRAYFEESQH